MKLFITMFLSFMLGALISSVSIAEPLQEDEQPTVLDDVTDMDNQTEPQSLAIECTHNDLKFCSDGEVQGIIGIKNNTAYSLPCVVSKNDYEDTINELQAVNDLYLKLKGKKQWTRVMWRSYS